MDKIDKIRSVLKQSCMGLLMVGALGLLIIFTLENILHVGIEFARTKRLSVFFLGMGSVSALVCALLSFIKRKE